MDRSWVVRSRGLLAGARDHDLRDPRFGGEFASFSR